jgi:hypothetical protein
VIGLLLSLLAADTAAQPAQPRTAFFCQVADRAETGVLRPLNILLARTADKASEAEAVKTFDPTRLLEGGSFTRFMRRNVPEAEGYALLSGDFRRPGTYLLSLVFREGAELGAGLGRVSDGAKPRFVGRCLRYQSADTAADFQSFNAKVAGQ